MRRNVLLVIIISRNKPNAGGKQNDSACFGPADGSINSVEISANFHRIARLYISQDTTLMEQSWMKHTLVGSCIQCNWKWTGYLLSEIGSILHSILWNIVPGMALSCLRRVSTSTPQFNAILRPLLDIGNITLISDNILIPRLLSFEVRLFVHYSRCSSFVNYVAPVSNSS